MRFKSSNKDIDKDVLNNCPGCIATTYSLGQLKTARSKHEKDLQKDLYDHFCDNGTVSYEDGVITMTLHAKECREAFQYTIIHLNVLGQAINHKLNGTGCTDDGDCTPSAPVTVY